MGEASPIVETPPRNGPALHRRVDPPAHLSEALALLLQAHDYARELDQDVWNLAVELPVLRDAKVTNSDLRWMIARGYVEHALETTAADDAVRQFRRTALPSFAETTCLVLTPEGVALARQSRLSETLVAAAPAPAANCRLVVSDDAAHRPKWDHQRRQLRVGLDIVKEFKLPSPNQETVLMAFEEEGWPPRIDDPLPPLPQLDPRRRLHDTIKALNRKQKQYLIRFMGDGSGEGIRWELTDQVAGLAPQARALSSSSALASSPALSR
jgi:hypothetical protein